MIKSLAIYSLGYGVFLTVYSIGRFYSNASSNQILNSVFGFAVIAIIYLYLKWSLRKLNSTNHLSRGTIILIGTLITIIGCTLSTTTMWFHNESIGLLNNISSSIRAIIVNGVIGLIVSVIVSGKLPNRPRLSGSGNEDGRNLRL